MTKKSDAPAIRFKGFSDAWEQRKLGELVDRVVRKNTNNESTLPLTISAQYGLVDQITYFNNRVASRDVSNYYLVLNGEFAYNKSTSDGYPFGAVKRLDLYEKGVLSTLYIVFAPKKEQQIDSDYLTVFFDTDRWHKGVAERAAEGARNHGLLNISAEDFFDIDLSVPKDIVEQKQIGAFIRQLDNLITLHQRECISFTARAGRRILTANKKRNTSSWEQRKLSEIADKVTEKNSGLQYVETFTNSAEFGIISQRDFFDHDIAKLSSLDGYYIVKNEDFVYNPRISTSAPVGPINRNKLGRTGVMSPLYTVFRPHDVDTTYLEHFFKCAYWHSFMNFNGDSGARSDRFSIKNDVFFQMPIPLPHIDEQRKIGELLTCLDHLITLHQRKCVFLFGFFQAFISMIFTASTFSWEQRKLGDVGETYTGLSGKTKADFGHGQARFVTYMNVFSNPISNPEMTEPIEIDPKQNEVEVGDVFFTTSSETPEEVGMSSVLLEKRGKIYLNSFCFGFRPTEKIDSYYLAYMLRSESAREKIILLAQGISRYNISKNKVMEIAVSLPSLDEQKLIGQDFRQLDNLITLHQRECISFTARAGRRILTANKKRNTSSWEQRKLTEFVEFFSGLTYTPNDVQENGTLVLRSSNVSNGEVVDADNVYVNPQVVNSENVKVGDIVVVVRNGSRSLIGKHAQIKAFMPNTVIGAFMTGIRSECPEFTNALLNTSRFEEEIAMNMGATINQITGYMFSKMEFKVPCLDEQKKIGEYFEKLDRLVTLHQRQLFFIQPRIFL